MGFAQTIILGIIEGLTEFLPVSSTGHLVLAARVLGLAQSDFLKSFEIAIQLGAILAVAVLYWKTLVGEPRVAAKILTAFAPTAAAGLLLYNFVRAWLGNEAVILWALFGGGVFLILFEMTRGGDDANSGEGGELGLVSYSQAFWIGLIQAVSMIPGVSRAAATIVGGMLAGLSRKTAVEFSFLLAAPTMLAAAGFDLFKNFERFSFDQFGLLTVGFLASFLAALGTVKFLLGFIKNHNFTSFGVYRVAVAAMFWILLR